MKILTIKFKAAVSSNTSCHKPSISCIFISNISYNYTLTDKMYSYLWMWHFYCDCFAMDKSTSIVLQGISPETAQFGPYMRNKRYPHKIKKSWQYRTWINSLAPGRSECDPKNVIFSLVLLTGIFRSSHDNALRWMPQDLIDNKWTLVQVMAWCHQAASHYLSQCWLSTLLPYGIARPQWVNRYHLTNMTILFIMVVMKWSHDCLFSK